VQEKKTIVGILVDKSEGYYQNVARPVLEETRAYFDVPYGPPDDWQLR
jgi:hypothetical protein